jgi:hypothetical protein
VVDGSLPCANLWGRGLMCHVEYVEPCDETVGAATGRRRVVCFPWPSCFSVSISIA